MSVELTFTFTEEAVARFAELVGDFAPVHVDAEFAQAQGFPGRLVHGLFVGAIFSGILGQQLPGPRSVINSLSLKMHAPVTIGETLSYQVSVKQVSEAAHAVILEMAASNGSGVTVCRGQSTCSFPAPART